MRISLLIEQNEIMAELRSKMEVCGSFIDKERKYYLKQIEGLELEIDKLRENLAGGNARLFYGIYVAGILREFDSPQQAQEHISKYRIEASVYRMEQSRIVQKGEKL